MQRKIKTAHENYLADILGVGSGDEDENSSFSSNRLTAKNDPAPHSREFCRHSLS